MSELLIVILIIAVVLFAYWTGENKKDKELFEETLRNVAKAKEVQTSMAAMGASAKRDKLHKYTKQ